MSDERQQLDAALDETLRESFPASDPPANTVETGIAIAPARPTSGLRGSTVERLACLLRHWTWADEARARFEAQIAAGWDFDENLSADHPFGAFYHWCALLCGLSDAAMEQGFLPPDRFEAIRADLDASLAHLRGCRQVLIVIPASLDHPRVADLLDDASALDRLRRLHRAFGDAIEDEQRARELELLES